MADLSTAKTPWLYLPDGWNTRWLAAKGGAGSVPARLHIQGDSLAVGVGISTFAGTWTEQLHRYLLSELGGRWGEFHAAQMGYLGGDANGGPWSSALNSATITRYPISFGGGIYSPTTTSVAYQTFTTPFACTAFDFYHYAWNYPGTWNYSLDGGANVQVTNPADLLIHKIGFSGLTLQAHTFSWGWSSANATVNPQGCVTYAPGNPEGGLFFGIFGASGCAMNDCVPASLSGVGTSSLAPGGGSPVGADLVVCQLVTNDVSNGITVAAFSQSMSQMIRAYRRAQPGCSFLFVIPSYPDSTIDHVTSAFGHQPIAYQYHEEILRLAQLNGCAVVNFHQKWGATPYASGYMPSNDLHYNQTGHNDVFAAIQALV
ncbi:MAG: SGNH/GDSL hydrolase family protein [Chloroflexota bacterium]